MFSERVRACIRESKTKSERENACNTTFGLTYVHKGKRGEAPYLLHKVLVVSVTTEQLAAVCAFDSEVSFLACDPKSECNTTFDHTLFKHTHTKDVRGR